MIIQKINENHIVVDNKEYTAIEEDSCIGCAFGNDVNNCIIRNMKKHVGVFCGTKKRLDSRAVIWQETTKSLKKNKIHINLENTNLPIKICKETKIN